jgi:hypothetical protein
LPRQLVHSKESSVPTLVSVSPPLPIRWKVITPGVASRWSLDINKHGERGQEPYVYIGLNHRDYLVFTAWLNELIVYLKSQKTIQKKLNVSAR